jgi:hypothetical protein
MGKYPSRHKSVQVAEVAAFAITIIGGAIGVVAVTVKFGEGGGVLVI